ncbi:MAG: acyl-CoA dehydrogenase family protein, partial [Chloroflexota bacterium]
MSFSFTSEQLEIRKAVIQFCRKELNPGIIDRDRDSLFSLDLWNKCAGMRLMALPYTQENGGDGFDFITTIAAFHALGYGCKDSGLVLAILSQAVCGLTIQLFSNKDQASTLLPDLADGKLIYCQGITEPGSGSDAFAMKTTAAKTGSEFILNGTKTMISNGPVAARALIYAVTDPEKMPLARISCFCVASTDPGFSRGKPFEKMGLRTLP